MQSPTRNTASLANRQRCGACSGFCPPPDGTGSPWGICAHTNGNDKMPGSVKPDQAVCVFRPSKFKPKEYRR